MCIVIHCNCADDETVFVVFIICEQVGDIVSIIDMPPAHESSWWRGKNRFEVIVLSADAQ